MKELVILENGKVALTNSLIISKGMKLSHHSVTRMIDKYVNRLNRMNGVVRFQIDKPLGVKGGRPVRLAWLNKKQFLYLATMLRNTETVLDFKEKLINEFERLQEEVAKSLAQRKNDQWIEQRELGKQARRKATDTIEVFLKYAEAQGSKHYPEKGYPMITNMEYKALFDYKKKIKDLRDYLSGQQLQVLAAAEIAVSKALQEGMDKNMDCHDIYQLAKERMIAFADIVGKSIVPIKFEQLELLKLK